MALLDLDITTEKNPDLYPDDDFVLDKWRRFILDRIDQVWGCDAILGVIDDCSPDYCGLPEHDPFTHRCWDHTPGNLSSGHM